MVAMTLTMFSVWDSKDQSSLFSGVSIHLQSSKKYRNWDCKKNVQWARYFKNMLSINWWHWQFITWKNKTSDY